MLGPILPIRITISLLEDGSKAVAHILGAETAVLDKPVRELAHFLQRLTVVGEVGLQLGCRFLLLVMANFRASTISCGKLLLLHRRLSLINRSILIAQLRICHGRSAAARQLAQIRLGLGFEPNKALIRHKGCD